MIKSRKVRKYLNRISRKYKKSKQSKQSKQNKQSKQSKQNKQNKQSKTNKQGKKITRVKNKKLSNQEKLRQRGGEGHIPLLRQEMLDQSPCISQTTGQKSKPPCVLGQGAFGIIIQQKCERRTTETQKKINCIPEKYYAVKYLFYHDFIGLDIIKEIDILNKIKKANSPFIIRLIDSYKIDKSLVIILEYIEGRDAKLTFETKKPNEPISWGLILGLKTLQEYGIIHYDIKPENIMIDTINERAVYIDFGLADFYNKEKFLLNQGSPLFIDPVIIELFFYKGKKQVSIDIYQIDIWSLGITMCFLYKSNLSIQMNRIKDRDADSMLRLVNMIGFIIKKLDKNEAVIIKNYFRSFNLDDIGISIINNLFLKEKWWDIFPSIFTIFPIALNIQDSTEVNLIKAKRIAINIIDKILEAGTQAETTALKDVLSEFAKKRQKSLVSSVIGMFSNSKSETNSEPTEQLSVRRTMDSDLQKDKGKFETLTSVDDIGQLLFCKIFFGTYRQWYFNGLVKLIQENTIVQEYLTKINKVLSN
jgi:serine/threonine protein kinase